jgi:hypothetical protein
VFDEDHVEEGGGKCAAAASWGRYLMLSHQAASKANQRCNKESLAGCFVICPLDGERIYCFVICPLDGERMVKYAPHYVHGMFCYCLRVCGLAALIWQAVSQRYFSSAASSKPRQEAGAERRKEEEKLKSKQREDGVRELRANAHNPIYFFVRCHVHIHCSTSLYTYNTSNTREFHVIHNTSTCLAESLSASPSLTHSFLTPNTHTHTHTDTRRISS